MKRVQDDINGGVGWCVAGYLGMTFYGNPDEIKLGIDEGMELGL